MNDGWTDLSDNYRLDWQYEAALDGNVALTGGLDLSRGTEFTVGLAFGTTQHDALSTLAQSLSIPFEETRQNLYSSVGANVEAVFTRAHCERFKAVRA